MLEAESTPGPSAAGNTKSMKNPKLQFVGRHNLRRGILATKVVCVRTGHLEHNQLVRKRNFLGIIEIYDSQRSLNSAFFLIHSEKIQCISSTHFFNIIFLSTKPCWAFVRTLVKFFPPVAQQPLVGQGLLIIEASQSHSDTPHSVGVLWTSDRPDAEPLLENTQH
jgi:hypothetical protein